MTEARKSLCNTCQRNTNEKPCRLIVGCTRPTFCTQYKPTKPNKLDGFDGLIEIDGKPVYLDDDGRLRLGLSLRDGPYLLCRFIPIEDVISHNEWVSESREEPQNLAATPVDTSLESCSYQAGYNHDRNAGKPPGETRFHLTIESNSKPKIGDLFMLVGIDTVKESGQCDEITDVFRKVEQP